MIFRTDRMQQRLRRWLDFYYNRYVGILERFEIYVRNLDIKQVFLTLEDVRMRKKSDTLFLLGSGPSINDMTEQQWGMVRRHDSLAINWFIVHPFVPTYFHTEVNRNPRWRQYFIDAMQKRREDYARTIFFVNSKARRRGLRPRFLPGLFSKNPIVCFFKSPKPVPVSKERPFRASDFEKSIVYRGTMNSALNIALMLEYKNIVLLGMDLRTTEYFYDTYGCTKWMREIAGAHQPLEERRKYPYGMDHNPKIGRNKHPVVDLYYALNDFVLNPKGIRLYVGSPISLLYPRIPLYPWLT